MHSKEKGLRAQAFNGRDPATVIRSHHWKRVPILSETEREILRLRYGIVGTHRATWTETKHTFAEISELLGWSSERVANVIHGALAKLAKLTSKMIDEDSGQRLRKEETTHADD